MCCPLPPEARREAKRPGLSTTLQEGDVIQIGDVTITVDEHMRRGVRLRILAPREVEITRPVAAPREVE